MALEMSRQDSKVKLIGKNDVRVNFLDLDTSRFSFSAPKEFNNGTGGRFVQIKYEGKNLHVMYPKGFCPFGIGSKTEMDVSKCNDYLDGKKITGYNLSVSFDKDYPDDPIYKKAVELDEFFINQCLNHTEWGATFGFSGPVAESVLRGTDDKGHNGKWSRIIKWSYSVDKATKKRIYKEEYPPRYQIDVPFSNMTESLTEDGKKVQSAVFDKCKFFDENRNLRTDVTTENIDTILPPASEVLSLAKWERITLTNLGNSLKTNLEQCVIFPRESFRNEGFLLDDDPEDVTNNLQSLDLGSNEHELPYASASTSTSASASTSLHHEGEGDAEVEAEEVLDAEDDPDDVSYVVPSRTVPAPAPPAPAPTPAPAPVTIPRRQVKPVPRT